MEIIKSFKSGKTKVNHNGVIIFLKPCGKGAETGMRVHAGTDHLSEYEAKEAYALVTGKDCLCREDGRAWFIIEGGSK